MGSDQSKAHKVSHRRGGADYKEGAAFGVVLAGDGAAVVEDDSIDDAEAESCALADGLGGVEGIEDAFRIADARAGVGELNDGFVSLLKGEDGGPAPNALQSPFRFEQRVHGVFGDFDEDLEELIDIAADARQAGLNHKFDADFSSGIAGFDHLVGALQDHVEVDERFFSG